MVGMASEAHKKWAAILNMVIKSGATSLAIELTLFLANSGAAMAASAAAAPTPMGRNGVVYAHTLVCLRS